MSDAPPGLPTRGSDQRPPPPPPFSNPGMKVNFSATGAEQFKISSEAEEDLDDFAESLVDSQEVWEIPNA